MAKITFFQKCIKADLDGTTFAYDCRMRFPCCSRHEKKITLDCRRILKHVLKSYNIFCDVHDSRRRVVGLIYTKPFVSQACRKLVACDKVVPCKSPLRWGL